MGSSRRTTQRFKKQCQETDQPAAALVQDLADRGMLDDTLVIWGGEFGRTNYCQGLYRPGRDFGRDHHPRCFTSWMAGGGIRPGISWGKTCEYGYNIQEEGVIYMTFMQHCSIYSALITSDLLINSKVVAIALPMFMVMLSKKFLLSRETSEFGCQNPGNAFPDRLNKILKKM